MASLSTIDLKNSGDAKKSGDEKNSGKRSRSDSDVVPTAEPAANPLRDYILESARTIHRTEFTIALLRWMLSIVAIFFSLILIDQWLWPLNSVARYAVWFGFIGGTAFWFAMKVFPLIGRTIHPHYAARQIESTIPEIKEGLITWVQLSGSETPPPKSVLNAVGRYVAKQLKGQDIASVIDQLNPLKLAAALMGLTFIGAIYLATSPKNVPATIQRLLMPWANVAPATRVQILSVTPGDATVIQGSNANIEIQVRGWQRQDSAVVRYSTDDGQTIDQRVAMSSDIEGLSYRVELGKTFGGILQPIHYTIEAGDAVAGPFAIDVQAVPLSTLERIEYVYPEYMRLSPRTLENDGRIEGPEGTRVKIFAKGNQPMRSARVEFDSTVAKNGGFQSAWIRDLDVSDHAIEGEWVLEVDEKRSNPTRYQYRIRSTNLLGESAPEPVVYPMIVVTDMAPEVDFAAEIGETIQIAANDNIEIEIRASDPDFGLTKLVLDGKPAANQLTRSVWQEVLLEEPLGVTGQVVRKVSISPKQLGLQVNDVFNFVVTASDNRHDPQTRKPASNVVKSRVVSLQVTPPNKTPGPSREERPNKGEKSNEQTETNPNGNKNKGGSASSKSNGSNSKDELNKKSAGSESKGSSSKEDSSNKDSNSQPKTNNNSQQKPRDSKNATPNNQASKPNEPRPSKNDPDKTGENSSKQDANDSKTENKSDNKTAQDQQQSNTKGSQKPKPNQENSTKQKTAESQNNDNQSKQTQGNSSENEKSDDPSGAEKGDGSQGSGPDDSSKQSGDSEQGDKQQGDKQSAQGSNGAAASKANSQASSKAGKNASGKPEAGNSGSDGSQDSSDESNGQSSSREGMSSESGDRSSDGPGESAEGQAPTHDGEAFERLQKILDPNDTSGASQRPSQSSSSQEDSKRTAGTGPEGAAEKGPGDPNPGDSNTGDSNTGDSSTGKSKNDSPEKGRPDKSGQDSAATRSPKPEKSGLAGGDKASNENKSGPADSNGDASANDDASAGGDAMPSAEKGEAANSSTTPKEASTSGGKAAGSQSSKAETEQKASEQGSAPKDEGSPNGGNQNPKDGKAAKEVPGERNPNGENGSEGATPSESIQGDPKGKKTEPSSESDQGDKRSPTKDKGTGGNPTTNNRDENAEKSPSTDGKGAEGPKSKGQSNESTPSVEEGGQAKDNQQTSSNESGRPSANKGQSDKSKATGSQSSKSQSGAGSSNDGQAGGTKANDRQSTGSQDKGSQAGGAQAGNSQAGGSQAGGSQNASNTGDGNTSSSKDVGSNLSGPMASSPANNKEEETEYAKSATDLVLESLKRQRELPDPELLKKMGWSKEQMQSFVDRWTSARDQAMVDPTKRKDYEDMLQSLGLVPQAGSNRAIRGKSDSLSGLREEGARMRPPESLRERFESFRKAAQKPAEK